MEPQKASLAGNYSSSLLLFSPLFSPSMANRSYSIPLTSEVPLAGHFAICQGRRGGGGGKELENGLLLTGLDATLSIAPFGREEEILSSYVWGGEARRRGASK